MLPDIVWNGGERVAEADVVKVVASVWVQPNVISGGDERTEAA